MVEGLGAVPRRPGAVLSVPCGAAAPPRRLHLLPDLAPGFAGHDPLDLLLASLPSGEVLRFGPGHAPLRALEAALGASVSAVALDLSEGLDLDALGRAEGLVRGGGALYLRLPAPGRGDGRLAVAPYGPADVGDRALELAFAAFGPVAAPLAPAVLAPAPRGGTPEQDGVVQAIVDALRAGSPARLALMADRGRGKSAAIGRALASAPGRGRVLTGPSPASAGELRRFAGADAPLYLSPAEALAAPSAAVLVVEEAAQLGVPLLRALSARHAGAVQLFATTVCGYEGSGRGFALRFWPGLAAAAEAGGPAARALRLQAPIRWAAGDPLEAAMRAALLLDAAPAPDDLARSATAEACAARLVPKDELVADDGLLRAVFGLLVAAHYRTSPADLRRLLDAPNLDLHALFFQNAVVGVCLVAREGGLSAQACADLGAGRGRIRGNALPDTLGSHLGEPAAGALQMARSLRLAVHPAARRRGLASALVQHVHAHYDVDLFGTLFGATPALLGLRAGLGYHLCRVASATSAASGEPSALMIRPVSAAAEALVARLRLRLRGELPAQLPLLEADAGLPLGPLRAALLAHAALPPEAEDAALQAAPVATPAQLAALGAAMAGPCPMDALPAQVAAALRALPGGAGPGEAALRDRYLGRRSWSQIASEGSFPTVKAAQRAARRALRALLGAAPGA